MKKSYAKFLHVFLMVSMVVWSMAPGLGAFINTANAIAPISPVTTNSADGITAANATLHGTNGDSDADGHSFWVSLNPLFAITGTDPATDGAFTTIDFGHINTSTSFSASLTDVTSLPAVAPGTTYYFVAWSLVGGTWQHGDILNFTTPPSTPVHFSPADNSTLTTAALTEIDWSASTDAEYSPVTYTYESANDPTLKPDGSFVTPIYTSGVLTDPKIPTAGTGEGVYYWHVKATDSAVPSNSSPWTTAWKVTVDNTPPTQVSCPEGTTQSASPLETVVVPADSSTNTLSSNSLTNGVSYILKAYGTANAGDAITFDARYSFRDQTSTQWTDIVSTYESYGPQLLDLLFNGSTPWGNFNSSHEYQYLTVGNGSPASFLINDINYPNNTGNLNVDIYSCNPNTTPPTTGIIQITKYECPADTSINRNDNGVTGQPPAGCVLQSGKNFSYAHGAQLDGNGPWDDFNNPLAAGGTTDGNGVLTIPNLSPDGRYIVFETNTDNNKLADGDILGLYCAGDADPTPTHNDNGDIALVHAGETTKCVAYNKMATATLTVVKHVENNYGGQLGANNFNMKLTGQPDFAGSEQGTTFSTLAPGEYTVSEDQLPGYSASFSGDCDSQTGVVTLVGGNNKTCVVTNTAIPGHLTIVKNTVGGDGKFEFTAQGFETTFITTEGDVGHADFGNLNADAYAFTEVVPSGWMLTSASCDSEGETLDGNTLSNIVIPLGGTVTCTFTDTKLPTLKLIKAVDNQYGGNGTSADWQLSATNDQNGFTDLGNSDVAHPITPGIYYALSETPVQFDATGYTASAWNCNTGSFDLQTQSINLIPGENATCTITNNSTPGSITVYKHVVNDNGGEKTAGDFNLHVNIPQEVSSGNSILDSIFSFFGADNAYAVAQLFALQSFQGNEDGTTIYFQNPTSYTVTEDPDSGYTTSISEGCSGDVAMGQHVICTVTNTAKPALLTIIKDTGNEGNNGTFTFSLSGTQLTPSVTTSGGTGQTEAPISLNAGPYDLQENVPEGWDFGSVSCVYGERGVGESIAHGEHLVLDNGDSVTCTFHNAKKGTIEITKYECPANTSVTRAANGVGDGTSVPQGCVPQSDKKFGYVHGSQTDSNSPYPELNGPFVLGGLTDGSGILDISGLASAGRYLVAELNSDNQQLPAGDILGLYCAGDGDTSGNNDNQELTFVPTGGVVHCVAYNKAAPVLTLNSVTSGGGGGGGGCIAGTSFNFDLGRCVPNGPGGQVLGAATFHFTLNLRMGSHNNDVLELQKLLTTLGFYSGAIDGNFGPLTKAAVKAFQAAHPPLVVDGRVGPATRAVLNSL